MNNISNYFTRMESEFISQAERQCDDSNMAGILYLDDTNNPWNEFTHFVIRDDNNPIHIYRKRKIRNEKTIITDEEVDDSNVQNVNRIELESENGRNSVIKIYAKDYSKPIAHFSPLSSPLNSFDWIRVSSDLDNNSGEINKLDIPTNGVSLKELNNTMGRFKEDGLDDRYKEFTNFYDSLTRVLGIDVLLLLSRLHDILDNSDIPPEEKEKVTSGLLNKLNSYGLSGNLGDPDSRYVRVLNYLNRNGIKDFTVRPLNAIDGEQFSIIPPDDDTGSHSSYSDDDFEPEV